MNKTNTDKNELITKNFDIEGMSCASCAMAIEKKLKSLPGVNEVKINVVDNKGKVVFDPSLSDTDKIVDAVSDAGYKATLEKSHSKISVVTLEVKGMTCSACSQTVEKTLNNLDGVDNATVNLLSEKATISYDPAKIRLIEMADKVDKAGYTLSLEEEPEETDRHEEKMDRAKRKMLASIVLAGTIMVLMMVNMFVLPIPGYLLIIVLLGIPVVFGTGLHVHVASIKSIKNLSPNMDVLVSLGSLPPFIIGLLGFFFPIQTFIEMAVTIMTFHLIGKYLETRAKGKASQAIKKLIQMGAKTARVIIDGKEVNIPTKDLQVGDIMVIRQGEKIPTDGEVVEGFGNIDESMATGESMPVRRGEGDKVIGSTINKQGFMKIKATKVGKDTFLSQVIKLVDECQGSKVPIQEFADRVTGYFVPVILVLTFIVFISFNIFPEFHLEIIRWGSNFLPWVNPDLTPFTLSFITATAVLVVSCPCALGLGTPTALMVGSGVGAQKGILIRNGEAIQTLKDVSAIAFDKTGTITKGKPEVTDFINLGDKDDSDVLYRVLTVENASEHPLAGAVLDYAKLQDVTPGKVENYDSFTGKGIKGVVDGEEIFIGNRKLMSENNIDYKSFEETLTALEEEAKTAMLVSDSKSLIAIIAVADPIKEDSINAITALEKMGIKTAMITGDNERTAKAIGKSAGISHIIADVFPEGKVDEISKLQQQYGSVAMVGDGINDAPALKQANVGIAIGTGTDIAIEAADVTVVRGELTVIVTAIKLSKAIFGKIKENYFWAWVYNAIAIPVAMLGLLHPMIGAAAMAMSSLNVVYNSLRLKKAKL